LLGERWKSECEAGCYRCLLSYYNQTEHPLIDRREDHMLEMLCRLARGTRKGLEHEVATGDSYRELMNASTSSLEKAWLRFIASNGHRLPTRAQPLLEIYATRPDFAYTDTQTLVYIDGPHHHTMVRERADAEIDRRLTDAGYTVGRCPADQSSWPGIAAEYAWVFGPNTAATDAGAASGIADAPH